MANMALVNRLDQERRREQEEQLVSLKLSEVAELLSVSDSTVHRLVSRGHLASFRAGARARRVRVADLRGFIEGERGM